MRKKFQPELLPLFFILNTMKKTILAGLLFCSSAAQAASYAFTIENPSPFARTNQPIVLTTQQFGGSVPAGFPTVKFRGKTLAVQCDDLNKDGKTDELALIVNLQAGEKALLKISFSSKPPRKSFSSGTFARLYRLTGNTRQAVDSAFSTKGDLYDSLYNHGPYLGNQRIGARFTFDKKQRLDFYRINGKSESDGSNKEALNATDSVDALIPTEETLAAGGLQGWNGKKITFAEPAAGRTVRILASGPVRAVAEMVTDRWKYQKQNVLLTTRIVLYSNRNDVEITNFIQSDKLSTLTFCTGIPKLTEMKTRFSDDVLAVWGLNNAPDDSIRKPAAGVALFCPQELISGKYREDNGNFLYLLKGFPVIRYQALIQWESAQEGINSADAFFNSLLRWKQSITEPVLIRPKH